MLAWIRKFLTDETAFVGLVRALALGLGGIALAYPDALPGLPKWVGIACMAGGGFIRAGEKNPSKP